MPAEGRSGGAVRTPSLRFFLLAAFFLTGATGLIYQVLWSRMLVLSFGYTIYSISTVITAFMGGLAAGSVAGGALADRVRNPVIAYGAAEAGVGLLALATYPLLAGLPHAIAGMRETLSIPFYGFNVWTFLVAIGILAPPAALMGLTLPLLARAMTAAKESASTELGSLYALNTLGAAIGSIATGFVLIAAFGVFSTIVIAASMNVLVGAAAIALFRRTPGEGPRGTAVEPVAAGGKGVLREPLFWAFGVSGFASLAAEVIWIRTFSPYLENSTYAFSLILAIFLLGIAAGSWAGRAWASRAAGGPAGFAFCQVLAGVATGAGLILLFVFIQRYYAVLPSLGLLIRSPSLILEEAAGMTLILVPSTFFLGAGFPFIARWAAEDMAAFGGRTGKLYAANTVGSILGAVGGGFLMLPLLGTRDSLVFLTTLYLVNGGAVLFMMGRAGGRAHAIKAIALTALLAIFVLTLRLIDDPNVFAIRNAYKDFEIAAHREDPDVNVTLLKHRERDAFKLYLNLRLVSGSGWLLTPWMTHLPLMLQDAAPSRMLIIGLGIGHAYNIAIAHYPEMKVEVVELVPSVAELYFAFNPLSAKAARTKNGSIIIADGRSYLLSAREPYDAILIDPTPPLYGTGAVNLYTADFFRIVRERLAPRGIFLLRIPQSADEASVRLLLRTVIEVFPHVSLWKPPLKNLGYSVVASSYDYDAGTADLKGKVMGNPHIEGGLRDILLQGTPVYIGSGASILGDAEGLPVVTDDRPYLEFPLFYRRLAVGRGLP
jgi:spermidine synthase